MKDMDIVGIVTRMTSGNPFLTSFFLTALVLIGFSLVYLLGFQVGDILASLYKK